MTRSPNYSKMKKTSFKTKKRINKLNSLVNPSKYCGAPGRIRTCGTRIRNPELYPPELLEQLYGYTLQSKALHRMMLIDQGPF
jgi:hypothetical protein